MMPFSLRSVVLAGVGTTFGLMAAAGPTRAADAPAAPAAAAAGTCKAELSLPAYGATIKQNPSPNCFPTFLGDIYIGGAFTGYAFTQTNPFPFSLPSLPDDRKSRVDFSNLQVFLQKPEGAVQFFVQAGGYSIPALGLPIFSAIDQTDLLFGPVPVAFGKIVLNDNFSIQGGRMPTLIGSEAPFTFQNINIQRGLLFNQENVINHGVQLNYSNGPLSLSVAGTDGFFSGEITWFTGALTYKLDDNNTVGVNGGLNLGRTDVRNKSIRFQFATPLLQQNSAIFNANYTYSNGPLTITPYFQYTTVQKDLKLGILNTASTYGGAILAAYAFTENFSIGLRGEYEEQTGRRNSGTTSLLYGPGSSAWSFTVTPTYTVDRFFIRGEYSRVELAGTSRDATTGVTVGGFGRAGNKTSQDRWMVETGITF